jgi:4-hydroxybenzoate polyprenyltransferase
MLAGWFIVGPDAIAPASLLLGYWMIGCYFMGIKRFAEYRRIGDPRVAAGYRRSFAYYNENRLLVSVMFYGSTAMLMFGAFVMRYRLSLILSFPFIALVMALYLELGLVRDSPVQSPESLYRQPRLMVAVIICAVVMTLCLFYDFPVLETIFAPTAPGNLTNP